ncbi:MAG: glycosyltransferase [Gammaproteobacteria bacterium]|nr:glycosyltransferase [Gammaproteobacteria bacterium]
MKVGVVMTCRDAWDYTRAALDSIASEYDLLTIVVDDGSTDGTKDGLEAWQDGSDDRMVLTDPPFDSLAGKWNAGIRKAWEAGCDCVLVTNNDVLFHPETIDRLVERIQDDDVVLVSAHNIEGIFTESGIPPEFIISGEWELEDDIGGEAECPDFSCFMLSRECWDIVGDFDERYEPAFFEDNDYHERILRKGLKALNIPSAPYYHYGSITVDQDQSEARHERFRKTRDKFYQKWGYVPAGHAAVGKLGPIRLLVIGDGAKPTGFARVTHSILERLHETGDYDIHHLAINHHGDPPGVPWRMYPAHLSNPPDQFGRGRVRELYDALNPDAVFMVQDVWHISEYVQSRHGMRGLVAYYPVDSPNLHPLWTIHLGRCVEVCTYTEFGAAQSALSMEMAWRQTVNDVFAARGDPDKVALGAIRLNRGTRWLDQRYQIPMHRLHQLCDPGEYNVVPHGVDSEIFRPVDQQIARRRMGVPEDAFVVGYVHRNQPRKRQDLMLRAFAKFIKGVRDDDVGIAALEKLRAAPAKIRDAVLVLHCALEEQAGWDLEELASSYGIDGRVQFSKSEQGHITNAELNLLYNTFDVNANLGGGEGWGLSHFESGVSGVPQMVPDWAATRELWHGRAKVVPVVEVRHADYQLNTMQAQCSSDAAADMLLELYEDAGERERLGEAAREFCTRDEYTWDSVAENFDGIIKRAATLKGVPHKTVTLTKQGAAA